MQFHHISKLASALVAAGLLSGVVHAQELTGTLKKIKDTCLLYTSPSPRDGLLSRMPSSA